MTKLINQVGNPPIQTPINASQLSGALANADMAGAIHSNWQKYLQQLTNAANVNNYYGNPSVLLNSDFYWNTGVSSPVTQADGDGAFISEKWQVHGAAAATYTIAQEAYAGNSSDQIGSTTYLNVEVPAYTIGDFYLYQRQAGSQFLRRYQSRRLNLSMLGFNNQNKSVNLNLEVFFFFDPASITYTGQTILLDENEFELSDIINTDFIGNTAVGAGAYVEFRLRFGDLGNGTANFDINYIKAEMADEPTILYVDHALERTRINNS